MRSVPGLPRQCLRVSGDIAEEAGPAVRAHDLDRRRQVLRTRARVRARPGGVARRGPQRRHHRIAPSLPGRSDVRRRQGFQDFLQAGEAVSRRQPFRLGPGTAWHGRDGTVDDRRDPLIQPVRGGRFPSPGGGGFFRDGRRAIAKPAVFLTALIDPTQKTMPRA